MIIYTKTWFENISQINFERREFSVMRTGFHAIARYPNRLMLYMARIVQSIQAKILESTVLQRTSIDRKRL